MKIKQTGVVELLDNLQNKDLWMYMVNGITSLQEGKAWFPLDNGQKGKTPIVLHCIIPKGKVPITMMYQPGIKDLLYPEQQVQRDILNDGFQQIFQNLIKDSWLLLGVISQPLGNDIPFAILYFESFGQAWYSLLNMEQKKVMDSYIQHLN